MAEAQPISSVATPGRERGARFSVQASVEQQVDDDQNERRNAEQPSQNVLAHD
jgi:hypothetical protein